MPTRTPLRALLVALTLLLALSAVPASAAECDPMRQQCDDDPGPPPPPTYATPDTTIESSPQRPVQNRRPSITYKSSLANVRYICRLAASADEAWSATGLVNCGTSGAVGTTAEWKPAADLEDGAYWLHVRACKDHTASVTKCDGSSATAGFRIDNVGPVAPRFSGVEEGAHLKTPATVNFHNLEDPFGPSFVCALDPDISSGAVTLPQCTNAMPVGGAGFAQGPHAIYLKTTDRAGNWSPTAILSFVWDTVAPARELTRTGPANAPRPSYAFTITDAHSAPATATCRLKGEGFEREEPCTAAGWTSEQELTDGLYSLSVVAKDKAGNEATTSEMFEVDRTAPGAATNLVWDAAARKVTFDVPAGAEQVTCAIDGGAEKACTSPFDASGAAPGDHTLVVTVRDWAGNEAKASKAFSIPAPPKPQSGGEPKAQQDGGASPAAGTGSVASATGAPTAAPRTTTAAPAAKKPAAKKKACFKTKKVKGKKKRVKVACKKAPAKKRAARKRR